MSILRRIMNLFSRSKVESEIDAELKAHIEMRIEDNIAGGMSPEKARRDAYLRFGNAVAIKEQVTGEDAALAFENILRDVRIACRHLIKSPGFTITAILTLTLGIGANTATFSVVDAVMLRPLPYAQPESLVSVVPMNTRFPEDYEHNLSYPDYFDFRNNNRTISHLVSYHDKSYIMTVNGEAVHADAQIVAWDLLPTLGVQPLLGRGFSSADEKAGTRVILISHALWMTRFAGDKSVIGRTVSLSDQPFTIIGVMPSTFRFPVTSPENAIWTTLAVDKEPPGSAMGIRGMHFLNAIGRLKPGVSVAQATQDFSSIASNLARQYPNTNSEISTAAVRTELNALIGDTKTALYIVLAAVGFVLLIACGNIANLLLARMRERQREIAMRAALGASRSRIIRQILVECLILSLAGGLAGCLLAFAGTPALLSLIGDSIPRAADAGVDLRLLFFVVLISCASGLVFGIVPAITASKTKLVSSLKDGGGTETGSRDRFRSMLVTMQVAVGLLLATSAGLLITSFLHLRHLDIGFHPDHLLTLNFETPDSRYRDTRPLFYNHYFERLQALPGVQFAAGIGIMPMTNDGADIYFENPEHPVPVGQHLGANVTFITPNYFRTMQIPLLSGRDFSEADNQESQPVMLVDQAFVQKFFPGENVIGKRITPSASNAPNEPPQPREIIGVVGSIRLSATQLRMRPEMYLPAGQLGHWCCLRTVVRTSVESRSLEPSVRQLVTSLDRQIPITDVHTMQELMSLQLSQPRFAMVLLGIFAVIAVSLTVIGLYGVITYSVSRRTREIGIRMAMGAQRIDVIKSILREAAIMLLTGIALGTVASLLSASLLKSMLYGIGPRNPWLLLLIATIIGITGIIASFIPARHAASVDPIRALRAD